ncbi:MAG: NAD-dependent epimerase/dehydratase family protein, partial [Proteobacteria bacterium]|nr:NAD-dependent epimerase/dehydratase family protein [Pseudomonadota bacterium]
YVASWIVKRLLDAGVTVHGTVRDPSNADKTKHLWKLAEGAAGELKLFAADLTQAGSFSEAMQGCGIVYHTASPFEIRGVKDPEAQLIRPAVEGVKTVLASAGETESVRRIVLTSSCVAIYGDNRDSSTVPGGIFTEEHWNHSSTSAHQPYSYSKTLAEKAAWEVADTQNRYQLVVINPAFVLGPSLGGADGVSNRFMLQAGDGTFKSGVPDVTYGVVDVRDVAEAHLLAAYSESTDGRFIVCHECRSILSLTNDLRQRFGDRYPFPKKTLSKFMVWLVGPFVGLERSFVAANVGFPLRLDNTRSRETLGLAYRPIADTLGDHFQQMLDDGFVKKRA